MEPEPCKAAQNIWLSLRSEEQENSEQAEAIFPLSVNPGRTSTIKGVIGEAMDRENVRTCSGYVDRLLNTWWSAWKQWGRGSHLPYNKLKAEKRPDTMWVGDISNVFYGNKVKGAHRICQVAKLLPSGDGLVRKVKVSFRPRRHHGPGVYRPVELFPKSEVVPADEAPVEPAEPADQEVD